ncbi:MAG TPA: DUF2723 domain-containing protein [Candidatus Ozemobacteraceae bacterium]|nr:DUF2723 domain-containing protein [Candidatus Ozemobacteraceae bacterium]
MLIAAGRSRLGAALIVFAAGLALYLPTLQPGIGWYNAPELVCAALTLDVPHSPGYPLFTRLASAAIALVPWGDPAWRVNLLSAVLGAAAAGAWTAWLAGWGIRRRIAACAGIWLLLVPTFWEQATSSEVYTLECFILASFMLIAQAAREGRVGFGKSLATGLLLAAGIGHRPTFALLAAGALFTLQGTGLRSRLDASSGAGIACGLLVGAIPTLDLFVRLQNENRILIDPMIGRGLDGFWRFFTGADYRNAIGVFGPGELFERFKGWLSVVSGAGIWMPILATAAVLAKNRDWRIIGACLWLTAVNTGFVLNYNAFEAHTMLLPTLMAIGGLGASLLSRHQGGNVSSVMLAVMVATGLAVPISATRIEGRSRDSEIVTRRIAALVPERSVLMMNNDIEFRPLYYLRLTRKFRPDLGIRLVDALTASDAADLEPEVARGVLFGSLIYPASSARVLGERYMVESWGYLRRIRNPDAADFADELPPTWRRLEIGSSASIAVDPDVQVLPLGGQAGRIASNTLLPGDVIVYRYMMPIRAGFNPCLLKAELVDDDGRGFADAGVKTGHDIHFLSIGNALMQSGYARAYAVVQRTIVVPDRVWGTNVRLTMCTVSVGNLPLEGWITDVLPGAHPLNAEGATELFRLRNGMGGAPLFFSGRSGGIDDAPSSGRIVVAEFTAPPNIP